MNKIVFNISFHWQIEQLKWHLENAFSWQSSLNFEFVIVSAHRDNLNSIREWICEFHRDKIVDYIFIEEDHQNHLGCTVNVIEGLRYIKQNKKDYSFVANVEADNQFRDEAKFLKLIDKLKQHDKHMLLVDHPSVYGRLFNNFPSNQSRNYFHMTTLNIYTKYYVDNHLPLEYDQEFMDYGWCGAPGTPFEPYFALALMKKMNIQTDDQLLEYLNRYSYPLHYNRALNPCNFAEPDDLTPDRYMKYGILNCPNARNSTGASRPEIWKAALRFVELYDSMKYDFE